MDKILKDFNDYKGFLIAGGVVLGGYFQVIGLWGVGLEYIRFFSSTQILSDAVVGIVIILSTFGIYKFCKDSKGLTGTILILSLFFSFALSWFHYYSFIGFLSPLILGSIGIFFGQIYNISMKHWVVKKVSIDIFQGIGIVLLFMLLGFLSTYIGKTPDSFTLNDKINNEITLLGSGTHIQYFNDRYIFLVNDSGKIRKVKILKTEEFLY